jgi:hypothetical protein
MMRGFVLGLVGSLAWAGLAAGARAQPLAEGRECRPPAASPAGFQDCRTRFAAGQAFCRCRIVPGLDVARRSAVDEAAGTLTPRAGGALSGDAAASLH